MIHVFLLLLLLLLLLLIDLYISIPFPPFHEITRNSNSSQIATDIPLIDWEGDVVVAVERIGRKGTGRLLRLQPSSSSLSLSSSS